MLRVHRLLRHKGFRGDDRYFGGYHRHLDGVHYGYLRYRYSRGDRKYFGAVHRYLRYRVFRGDHRYLRYRGRSQVLPLPRQHTSGRREGRREVQVPRGAQAPLPSERPHPPQLPATPHS